MPVRKVKKPEITPLQYCPLCGSHDLKIHEVVCEELEPLEAEVIAQIKCQSCSFTFEATSTVTEWQFETPRELTKLECRIRELLDELRVPSHANTVEKFLYASALQLVANDALHAAQSNAGYTPNKVKLAPLEKYVKEDKQDEEEFD